MLPVSTFMEHMLIFLTLNLLLTVLQLIYNVRETLSCVCGLFSGFFLWFLLAPSPLLLQDPL